MFFYEVDTVKIDKDKAMQRYRRFNQIVKILRTLEFFFAAMFITWLISRSSPYFSSIFQLLGVFLRRFSTLLINHHFVFLLGNGIIITLFVKFGQFACDKQIIGNDYDEYLIGQIVCGNPPPVTVSDEKQIIPAEIAASQVTKKEPEVKMHGRSRSHEFDREKAEKIQLQRSETEPRRILENSSNVTWSVKKTFDVDHLSNEEFQRKVEAFIARQQKFLREESLSMFFS